MLLTTAFDTCEPKKQREKEWAGVGAVQETYTKQWRLSFEDKLPKESLWVRAGARACRNLCKYQYHLKEPLRTITCCHKSFLQMRTAVGEQGNEIIIQINL